MYLLSPIQENGVGSGYPHHNLGKYGKVGMRITTGVTQKQCLLWYFFFLAPLDLILFVAFFFVAGKEKKIFNLD